MNLLDLLSRGHIPRELPPAFSSEKFAEFYVNSKIKPATINSKNSRGTKSSYPKVGLIRKIITLTNPHNQTPLFECINANWTEIQSHYSQSKISANQPTSTTKISTNGRAIDWSSFKEFRRQCFTEAYFHKYELKTDISKYYPSIYTHSIAWAIHGKVKAKKQRRDKNLLGNKLDYLVQQTQDGQTSGLPIGPDSSVIIAEIIGTEIDKHIQSVFPEITGYRYVDDMYLYFDSQANAELCLKEIEHVFRDFELQVNSEKTNINQLPCIIEDEWVTKLRTFVIRSGQAAQLQDLYTFFNLTFALLKKFPNQGVLAYSIRKLKDIFIHHDNLSMYESILLKILQFEGSTFPDILRILLSYQKLVDREKMKKSIQEIIKNSSPRGYDYEVIWSLWYCISFKINIDDNVATVLSRNSNPIVMLMALQLASDGLISLDRLETSHWGDGINEESLYDERWIFAYEVALRGWVVKDSSYVTKSVFFGTLKNNNISFFHPDKQIIGVNDFNSSKKKIFVAPTTEDDYN